MQCKKTVRYTAGCGKVCFETPAVPCKNAMETGISQQDPAHVVSEITIALLSRERSRFMIPLPRFFSAESQNS